MSLTVTATALPGVMLIAPQVFGDERGFFSETWSQRALDEALDQRLTFVQDNHSRSQRGVLRGLHWQRPPQAQGKLVRVARGKVLDVAVDVRRSSPHCGQWVAVELSDTNHRQMWVPPGFAHGFVVLSDVADLHYKTTGYYAPQAESALRWDDPHVGVDWQLGGVQPLVSAKDAAAPLWDAVALLD